MDFGPDNLLKLLELEVRRQQIAIQIKTKMYLVCSMSDKNSSEEDFSMINGTLS